MNYLKSTMCMYCMAMYWIALKYTGVHNILVSCYTEYRMYTVYPRMYRVHIISVCRDKDSRTCRHATNVTRPLPHTFICCGCVRLCISCGQTFLKPLQK